MLDFVSARALVTLQRYGTLDTTLQAQISGLLTSANRYTTQLTDSLAGRSVSDKELEGMSRQDIIERLRQEERAHRTYRAIARATTNATARFFMGGRLKQSTENWHGAYLKQQAIPVSESVDLLVSGLVRWTHFQIFQLVLAAFGATFFVYQLYLLHTDIKNQELLLQDQKQQFESEQFESHEFRRTNLYATLYSEIPCPSDQTKSCPRYDRRSRQEAARALLRINESSEELDWAGAWLSDVDMGSGVDLRDTVLDSTVFTGAQLIEADLRSVSCSKASFQNAVLLGAKLNAASLYNTQLQGAYLKNADLTEVKAMNASFAGAILDGAVLTNANLKEADLSGAKLSDAELSGAKLQGARYTAETEWPADFNPEQHGAKLLPQPTTQP